MEPTFATQPTTVAPPVPTRGTPNPGPPPGTPPGGILDVGSINAPTPATAPPLHQNSAVADALTKAMTPQAQDAINSILGPALAHIQASVQTGGLPQNNISYYQPRPYTPIRHG